MGNVRYLPAKRRPEGETRAALHEMLHQTDTGELRGSIHITDTTAGTRFVALGACKDLLSGALTAAMGLEHMLKEIATNGAAANMPNHGPIDIRWPKRTLPKRLREATNFGELG